MRMSEGATRKGKCLDVGVVTAQSTLGFQLTGSSVSSNNNR